MMEQRLTDELVEKRIAGAEKKLARVRDFFRRGLRSEEMSLQQTWEIISDDFLRFTLDRGLKRQLSGENYPQFVREYERAMRGEGGPDPGHVPWLFVTGRESGEAPEADRKAYYRLMRAFHVGPEFFEPVPEGMPVPDVVQVHYYNQAGIYGTHFRCVDDGGLLADEAPAGKTFVLKNELGLRAVVTIREDRRGTDRSGMDDDEVVCALKGGAAVRKAEFLAEGYIEGYTAKEERYRPDILIRLGEGGTRVNWLAYWADAKDERAAGEYPLWRDYHCWRQERCKIQDRIARSLLWGDEAGWD